MAIAQSVQCNWSHEQIQVQSHFIRFLLEKRVPTQMPDQPWSTFVPDTQLAFGLVLGKNEAAPVGNAVETNEEHFRRRLEEGARMVIVQCHDLQRKANQEHGYNPTYFCPGPFCICLVCRWRIWKYMLIRKLAIWIWTITIDAAMLFLIYGLLWTGKIGIIYQVNGTPVNLMSMSSLSILYIIS